VGVVNETRAPDPSKWFPAAALVAIVGFTLVGLAVGLIGRGLVDYDRFTASLVFGAMLIAAVSGAFTSRFLVLPSIVANPSAYPPGQIARSATIVGYWSAVADTIYGLVVSVLIGGFLGLPFGAIAVLHYIVVSSFLRESLDRPGTD